MRIIIKKYIIILLPLLLATFTSFFFKSDLTSLNLPPLMPESYIFPIIWTILYLFMGISLYLIKDHKKCLIIFFIQLIVNLCWSFLFFNLKLYALSIFIIFLLICLVNYMLLTFSKYNHKSVLLNIPYFIWLFIAYYLACGIYFLN